MGPVNFGRSALTGGWGGRKFHYHFVRSFCFTMEVTVLLSKKRDDFCQIFRFIFYKPSSVARMSRETKERYLKGKQTKGKIDLQWNNGEMRVRVRG